MYEYLKKLLNKQIEVEFPDGITMKVNLISVDATGVTVKNDIANALEMIPFSSGAIFAANIDDIQEGN